LVNAVGIVIRPAPARKIGSLEGRGGGDRHGEGDDSLRSSPYGEGDVVLSPSTTFKNMQIDHGNPSSAMVFFFDPVYFLFVAIPALVISAAAQFYLSRTYAKWSQVRNSANLTGTQVGQALFARASVEPIPLGIAPGALSDHFDPSANVVRLSEPVATQPSVASMAIAAHELGHVQQHQTRSGLMALRNFLVPALRFSPTLSYICILIGIFANSTGLLWIGIILFGLMVLFSVLTLPVELDASRRAMGLLSEAGLLSDDADRSGARAVLNAAALTYVGAAVMSIIQLLYYVSLAQRRG